jgi:small conductance mechanosensitive channel
MGNIWRSAFMFLLLLTLGMSAAVQSAESAAEEAVTTSDPEIPQEDLKLLLKPLKRAELKVEADAWLQILEDKVRQISTAEIAVKDKLREIAAADEVEAALDKVEEAKSKAGASMDADEARKLIKKAEQELENSIADAKAATARVEGNPETAKVTAVAAKVAEDKAASEAQDTAQEDEETAEDSASSEGGNVDNASETVTDPAREKLDVAVAKRNEDRANLLDYLTDLRAQQTALIDRTNLAVDAFELKGGKIEEVEEYRQYVKAVSGIEVDVTDVSASWATITGWLLSEEGGLRWLKNISVFIAVILISMFLARVVGKAIEKVMARTQQTSQLLGDFLVTTSRRLVLAIGILIGLAALEINIGPLLAVIGAAGFVIAFALQNSLGNFASGILIMIFKPFDVGDVVEIGGVLGKVKSMNLLSVLINTPDNKAVTIPNNNVWSDSITNVTDSDTRRVDLEFGIGYGDDIETAQKIMEQAVSEHPLVLKDPEPVIRVHALGDSSVNFICRPWVKTEDYWEVYWSLTRTVKERFDQGGVSIPFPQQDIHVIEPLQVKGDSVTSKAVAADSQGSANASRGGSPTDSAVGGDVNLDGDVT